MSNLRQDIVEHFDEGELKTLCFDLRIVYDSLPGDGTAAKALALIYYFQQRNEVPRLLTQLRKERPNVMWTYEVLESAEIETEVKRTEHSSVNIQTIEANLPMLS